MEIGYVGNELYTADLLVLHLHANEVNPRFGVERVQLDVVVGRTHQIVDFAPAHGLHGGGERVGLAGFYLHKVVVSVGRERNDIDLVGRTTPIELYNSVAQFVA